MSPLFAPHTLIFTYTQLTQLKAAPRMTTMMIAQQEKQTIPQSPRNNNKNKSGTTNQKKKESTKENSKRNETKKPKHDPSWGKAPRKAHTTVSVTLSWATDREQSSKLSSSNDNPTWLLSSNPQRKHLHTFPKVRRGFCCLWVEEARGGSLSVAKRARSKREEKWVRDNERVWRSLLCSGEWREQSCSRGFVAWSVRELVFCLE